MKSGKGWKNWRIYRKFKVEKSLFTMKKFALAFAAFLLLNLVWMGFVREPLPPVPNITAELSDPVKLDFSINSMDYNGVELAMDDKIQGKGMYVQFKMANAWKTGRPGLVVAGIKPSSAFKGGMSPKKYLDDEKRKANRGKDFSDFMKNKKGQPVTSYTFVQTLVEDDKGDTYLRMTYDGPDMEMIQLLEVPRPVTVPAHVSRQFTDEGIIQFQPGTVAFDSKIRGFNIPVVIR